MNKNKMPVVAVYGEYDDGESIYAVSKRGFSALQFYTKKVTEERNRAVELLEANLKMTNPITKDEAGAKIWNETHEFLQYLKEKDA